MVALVVVAAEAMPVKADRLSTSMNEPSRLNKTTRKEVCFDIMSHFLKSESGSRYGPPLSNYRCLVEAAEETSLPGVSQ